MSTMSYDPRRNTQALKVILSELYVRWLSERTDAVEGLAREFAAAARAPASVDLSAPFSAWSGRHVDPSATLPREFGSVQRLSATRGGSPPATPAAPSSVARDDRTPSPVHPSTRFIGVDEMDFAHRGVSGTSPGGASPISPNAATSSALALGAHGGTRRVDPKVPLAPSSGGAGAASLEPSSPELGAPPPPPSRVSASHGRGSSHAASLAGDEPRASTSDIPLFYQKTVVGGVAAETPVEEAEALHAHFSLGGGAGGFARGQPNHSVARRGSSVGRPSAFDIDTTKAIRRGQLGRLCLDVFRVPQWLADQLHRRICVFNNVSDAAPLTYQNVSRFYAAHCGKKTPNRRLFELFRPYDSKLEYLTLDDFRNAIKCLTDVHNGLEFLKQPEFQEFYCRTVSIRIMYALEDRQNRKVSWMSFNRSDLPEVMRSLDTTADINQVLQYFSYEHFYVLYCKFWELDTDHDQLISLSDLNGYAQGALTSAVLSRVISGAGRKLSSGMQGKMDYEDFVYFCLSEEDKNTAPAIEYWFRVLDVDGDGILCGYELARFFEEQSRRLREACGEELEYGDMLCQMWDMIGATRAERHRRGVTRGDLKSCPTPSHFFNMIFNATKFWGFEHRDPFYEHHLKQQPEKSEWDRFARVEYDRLASEVVEK